MSVVQRRFRTRQGWRTGRDIATGQETPAGREDRGRTNVGTRLRVSLVLSRAVGPPQSCLVQIAFPSLGHVRRRTVLANGRGQRSWCSSPAPIRTLAAARHDKAPVVVRRPRAWLERCDLT